MKNNCLRLLNELQKYYGALIFKKPFSIINFKPDDF